jgi:hypothetical protein
MNDKARVVLCIIFMIASALFIAYVISRMERMENDCLDIGATLVKKYGEGWQCVVIKKNNT